MDLAEQHQVSNGTHGAKPAPLGQKTDPESHDQRQQQRGMHGTGTFYAVEQNTALSLALNLRKNKHQYQKPEHKQRQHPTHRGMSCLGAPQTESIFKKKGADPDTEGQSQQAQDGIAVSSGQTQ